MERIVEVRIDRNTGQLKGEIVAGAPGGVACEALLKKLFDGIGEVKTNTKRDDVIPVLINQTNGY